MVLFSVVNMSFLSITDPKKRDAMVRDYTESIKVIQNRNMNNRLQNTIDERLLNKMFAPVVKASEKVSSSLAKEIAPIKEELEYINEPESNRPPTNEITEGEENVLASYYLKRDRPGKDNVYGIYENDDGKLQMGNKHIFIDNDSIGVDDTVYKGTEGLWTLVTDSKPKAKLYDENDRTNYKKLLKQTGVIFDPHKTGGRQRPRTTSKWIRTIKPLVEDTDFFKGSGISNQVSFLPGNIKGMTEKLNLLLAEFTAGNKTTRNEIVSLLDELLRRKVITKREYQNSNSFLAPK